MVVRLCICTRITPCFFLTNPRCFVHRTRSDVSQLTAAACGFATTVFQIECMYEHKKSRSKGLLFLWRPKQDSNL